MENEAKVDCEWHRYFAGSWSGVWSVMVRIGTRHSVEGSGNSLLISRAVIDDFGTLVVVGGWY